MGRIAALCTCFFRTASVFIMFHFSATYVVIDAHIVTPEWGLETCNSGNSRGKNQCLAGHILIALVG